MYYFSLAAGKHKALKCNNLMKLTLLVFWYSSTNKIMMLSNNREA